MASTGLWNLAGDVVRDLCRGGTRGVENRRALSPCFCVCQIRALADDRPDPFWYTVDKHRLHWLRAFGGGAPSERSHPVTGP